MQIHPEKKTLNWILKGDNLIFFVKSPERTLFLVLEFTFLLGSTFVALHNDIPHLLTRIQEQQKYWKSQFDARKPVQLQLGLPDSADADPPLPPCLPGKRQT